MHRGIGRAHGVEKDIRPLLRRAQAVVADVERPHVLLEKHHRNHLMPVIPEFVDPRPRTADDHLAGMEKPRPDPASRRITDLLLAGHRLDEAETRVQMNPCLRFRLRFGEKEPLHRQLPGALQKLRHLFQAGNQGSSLPLATTYPRNRELSSRPVKKVLLQFNFYHCFSGRFPV